MQSRPPLQERAVDVVINFLARQRVSCVMWPYLPACGYTVRAPTTDVNLPRCRRVRRCLISRRRLSGTTTRRSLALFPHSDGLDVHTTDVSYGGPGEGREHWPPALPPSCWVYDGADYTTFVLLKTRFSAGHSCVRVVPVCMVYAQKYGSHFIFTSRAPRCGILLNLTFGLLPHSPPSIALKDHTVLCWR